MTDQPTQPTDQKPVSDVILEALKEERKAVPVKSALAEAEEKAAANRQVEQSQNEAKAIQQAPIPVGGVLEDERVIAVSKYFDVPSSELKDTAKSVVDLINLVYEATGADNTADILLQIRKFEDSIIKPSATASRLNHLLNFLEVKSRENEIRKAVSAWEI